jgi:hypothetical protein
MMLPSSVTVTGSIEFPDTDLGSLWMQVCADADCGVRVACATGPGADAFVQEPIYDDAGNYVEVLYGSLCPITKTSPGHYSVQYSRPIDNPLYAAPSTVTVTMTERGTFLWSDSTTPPPCNVSCQPCGGGYVYTCNVQL